MRILERAPGSIVAKVLVALSGGALTAWAVLHAAGTASVFAGPETMNGYAQALRAVPGLLWGVRAGFVLLLALHVTLTVRLLRASSQARPTPYKKRGPRSRSRLSRTMRWTGPLLGLWLVFHVLQMYGVVHPRFVPDDVHHNLLVALQGPLSNLSHVVAALLFGLHLLHGLWSLPQTLGLSPYWVRQVRLLGWTLAGALALAFLAPSVAVHFGWL